MSSNPISSKPKSFNQTSSDPSSGDLDGVSDDGLSGGTATRQSFRWPVAGLGILIAALGLSGLLDDSGAVELAWWVAPVTAAAAMALATIVQSVRSLFSPLAQT